MSDSPIQQTEHGVEIALFVQPRASRTRVVGLHDGLVKLQLAAPPVDGKANAALIAFLAKQLGVSRGQLALISGQQGRRKRVRVQGVDLETVRRALLG